VAKSPGGGSLNFPEDRSQEVGQLGSAVNSHILRLIGVPMVQTCYIDGGSDKGFPKFSQSWCGGER